jgi:hypothetical protein
MFILETSELWDYQSEPCACHGWWNGSVLHLKDAHMWFSELSKLRNLRKKICPFSEKCYRRKYGFITIFQVTKVAIAVFEILDSQWWLGPQRCSVGYSGAILVAFQRELLPLSSGLKHEPCRQQRSPRLHVIFTAISMRISNLASIILAPQRLWSVGSVCFWNLRYLSCFPLLLLLLLSWMSDQLVPRPLPKYGTTQTQKNTYTHQTSMP